LDQLPDTIDFEQEGTMLAQEAVEKAEEQVRPRAKKLSEKLKLQDATEALEEEAVPVTKKKTTRKKKAVEFEIIDEA
jgi:dsDNA-specific endonuclease/ATPase MutS2